MTDMLVRIASSSSATAARSIAGSTDDEAVRAGEERHYSLMDLEREREPSLEQLLRERNVALTYDDMAALRTRLHILRLERNSR